MKGCLLRLNDHLRVRHADNRVVRYLEGDGGVEEGDDIREHFPELLGHETTIATLEPGSEMTWKLKRVERNGYYVALEMTAVTDGYILALYDVTEEAHLERQLLQSRNENALLNERLRRLNAELEARIAQAVESARRSDVMLIEQSRFAMMGEMIANIAHQWRQPLNALGLSLFSLKDAWEFGEVDAAFIDSFYTKNEALIQTMSETIDDFRYFFRPSDKKIPFSPVEAIERSIKLLRDTFTDGGVRLREEIACDCKVMGPINQLMQVVMNLLSNAFDAVKSCAEASRWIRIELRCTPQVLRLAVEDGGEGISEENRDKIFTPYFTTKGAAGTGLGLYMSRVIIENNFQGRLSLEKGRRGARFLIELPVYAAEETE